MDVLPAWLGDSSGTRSGLWYVLYMMALQLVMAIVMGIMYSVPFGQTPPGGKSLLVLLVTMQLAGAFWCFCLPTANDRIDGLQNGVLYSLEAVSSTLLLASNLMSDAAAAGVEGGEPDLVLLTHALRLSLISSDILVGAIYMPIGVTIYNRCEGDNLTWRR